MTPDPATPGRELFPAYPRIPGMYTEEVHGLTDAQLDRARPEKSWGRWTIRDQVSHMAYVNYRWFLQNWGEVLFPGRPPRDPALADTGGADRRMDPARFHDLPGLLAAIEDGCRLAWDILGGETLASLREKVLARRIPRDRAWPSGDTGREWMENVVLKVHPDGCWRDERDPDLFHQNLEWTFRHVQWEAYAHLRTIQAHKTAEGLEPKVAIPEVGYLKILRWE